MLLNPMLPTEISPKKKIVFCLYIVIKSVIFLKPFGKKGHRCLRILITKTFTAREEQPAPGRFRQQRGLGVFVH